MQYKYNYNLVLHIIYLLNRLTVTNISHVTIPMILISAEPIDFIQFSFTVDKAL